MLSWLSATVCGRSVPDGRAHMSEPMFQRRQEQSTRRKGGVWTAESIHPPRPDAEALVGGTAARSPGGTSGDVDGAHLPVLSSPSSFSPQLVQLEHPSRRTPPLYILALTHATHNITKQMPVIAARFLHQGEIDSLMLRDVHYIHYVPRTYARNAARGTVHALPNYYV